MSDTSAAPLSALAMRVERLEDIEAIRRLHHAYGYFMDYARYDDAVACFVDDGEAVFLGGVYKGHDSLIRLYKHFLGRVYRAEEGGPKYGFLADHHLLQEVITVADDGQRADFRGRCYLALGSHESRPDMPELLPPQVFEGALYENSYVKQDGIWKIARLEYAIQWQALYDKGWTHTSTDLKPATVTWPDNPMGPDFIIDVQRGLWPERTTLPFHYRHPVTGAALS